MTYSNFGTHVRFAKSLKDLIKNHNSIESILYYYSIPRLLQDAKILMISLSIEHLICKISERFLADILL
jgi:hypothetical protein